MAEANQQQAQKTPVGLGQLDEPGFNLAPTDFDGAYRIATAFSKSTLVPKVYQGKPEDILVAWQYGGELGFGKMQSLQSIAVINGKPTLPGETLLALAYSSGELEDFEEVWDSQKKEATCTVKRKGRKPIKHSFSWADAERIKTWEHGGQVTLASKDTYKNYPNRMCAMRARGFALKDAFADKIKGMKTKEEAEEIHDEDQQRGPAMPREKVVVREDDVITDYPVPGESGPSESKLLNQLGEDQQREESEKAARKAESLSDLGPTAAQADEVLGKHHYAEAETKQEKPTEAKKQTAKAVTQESLIAELNAATVETWAEVKASVIKRLSQLPNNKEQVDVMKVSNRRNAEFNPRI